MYLLKKHRWHISGLAATLLLNSCALIAPPGDGTEEDPFNRNTQIQDNSGEIADYPPPTGDYSSPTDTTVGYPSPAIGGEYSVPPPVTDTYSPPPVTGTYPPPTVNYPPPATAPYYPPPSSSVGSGNYHTVQPGENLYRISKNYGLRYQDVAALNNIPPPYNISVGQRILMRGGSGMGTMPSAPSSSSASYHTIQRGENLYRISLKYGCSVADIARWNGLSPADYSNLKVGQRLRISSGISSSSRSPVAPPSAPASSSSNFHVVGPTETLTTIANSYGLTVYELALWNGISSPYTVYPGQRLLIVPP